MEESRKKVFPSLVLLVHHQSFIQTKIVICIQPWWLGSLALISHSVDGMLWRSVDPIPLGDVYMVKILTNKELWIRYRHPWTYDPCRDVREMCSVKYLCCQRVVRLEVSLAKEVAESEW